MHRSLLILLLTISRSASAQSAWTLTAERGWATYSSAAHDTSADPARLRPWRPAIYTIRVAREGRRFGLGLGAGVAFTEWGVNIGDFVVLPDESIRLYELAPEITYRLGGPGPGGRLRLHAGPLLDVWAPSGDERRLRLGGQTGASLLLPMTGPWTVEIRGDLAISRSLVNSDEETDEIQREATMRRGRLALGITRRL